MSTNRYVYLSNSYSTNGDGSTSYPLNWDQFLTELSGGGDIGLITENDYYLSGVRSLDTDVSATLSAVGVINFYSWNKEDPAIIYSTAGLYLELETPNFSMTDLLMQASCSSTNNAFLDSAHRILTRNYGTVIIDNCYLKINSIVKFHRLTSLIVRNSVIVSDGRIEGYCFDDPILPTDSMTMEFVNTIFDITDFKATTADNVGAVGINQCAFTSATSAFTNYLESNTSWSNIQDVWPRPTIFSADVSAISLLTDLNYLNADFASISATGDTNYTNTWLNGTRDGIGAIYFPTISGVSVSGSSALAALSADVYFILSGNDPFTVFSASSATYSFGDGETSSVSSNSILTHQFSANGSYIVDSEIFSFNEWYSITSESWTVLVGDFSIKIIVYDQNGNDITGGQTKPLNQLTFIASASALPAGSFTWDFGDSLSGTNSIESLFYTVEGIKSIGISAFAVADATVSATDSTTILVSATSAEYFVNITSAYDSSSSHSGTSADPFNWTEFKGMVETSGEYLDTYRLSGSRTLSANTSDRYVLNVDRRKMFTIRDWDVSAYGPWVLEVQDFSVLDQNSILSAAGCVLKNGIVYNKQYSSPGAGGRIVIGTTYDMFIVYQGQYSKIVIDPFLNHFCGGSAITSADAKIIGSTLYLSGYGWQDLFMSADFSAIGQTSYTLEVTDSVITNFRKYNSSYFCTGVANVIMSNDTFNRSSADISADFGSNFTDSQFDWTPPTDYPFTPSNDLYGKDIDYIRSNKKKLRPFSGITFPPNPGKNAPTYPGYETGLFGYPRNEYNTSGF